MPGTAAGGRPTRRASLGRPDGRRLSRAPGSLSGADARRARRGPRTSSVSPPLPRPHESPRDARQLDGSGSRLQNRSSVCGRHRRAVHRRRDRARRYDRRNRPRADLTALSARAAREKRLRLDAGILASHAPLVSRACPRGDVVARRRVNVDCRAGIGARVVCACVRLPACCSGCPREARSGLPSWGCASSRSPSSRPS